MRINWSDTPLQFIQAPPPVLCPFCLTDEPPLHQRSEDQGDGSILRKHICRNCSEPFRVVIEPTLPAVGNADDTDH